MRMRRRDLVIATLFAGVSAVFFLATPTFAQGPNDCVCTGGFHSSQTDCDSCDAWCQGQGPPGSPAEIVSYGGIATAPASCGISGAPAGLPTPTTPTGDGCGLNTAHAAEAQAIADRTSIPKDKFSCQRVGGSVSRDNCFAGACSGPSTIMCCIPAAAAVPAAPPAASASSPTAAAPVRSGAIQLPSCISDGNCSLDDIMTAGASFANFIFGISGAVFLAIFVYAGVMYLIAGGDSGRVSEAKKTLVSATIGILLVFGSYALVSFVYSAFVSTSTTSESGSTPAEQCTTRYPENVCKFVDVGEGSTAARQRTARDLGCRTESGLCPGGGTNYLCCPIDVPAIAAPTGGSGAATPAAPATP